MNYIDIAIIAIVVLFALIGLWKGAGKTFIKIFCFAGALAGAYFLGKLVVDLTLGVDFIKGFIVSKEGSLASYYLNSFPSSIASATEATKLSGVLGMYINPMIARYTALGGPAVYGMTYGQFIASNLAVQTYSLIIYVLLYWLLRVILVVLAWILKKIIVRGTPKGASRIFGFLLGLIRGASFVFVLLVISASITPLEKSSAYTEKLSDSLIGSFAAEYTYEATDKLMYGGDETDKTAEMLQLIGNPWK